MLLRMHNAPYTEPDEQHPHEDGDQVAQGIAQAVDRVVCGGELFVVHPKDSTPSVKVV